MAHPCLVIAHAEGSLPHLLGPYDIPGFARQRHIRLHVPPRRAVGSYPVLCMFDGQNVFDDAPSFAGGWHADLAADKVATRRRVAPVIVGIDHGGAARMRELSPFGSDRLDALLRWLGTDLLPDLRSRLPLVDGPAGIIAAGASLGGLAALYAHYRCPELFGGALCMSPAFWPAGGAILRFVAAQPLPWTTKVYLDCGAREGHVMVQQAERMAAQLTERGYGPDRLRWTLDRRGTHNERHWRRRLPAALRFVFDGSRPPANQ